MTATGRRTGLGALVAVGLLAGCGSSPSTLDTTLGGSSSVVSASRTAASPGKSGSGQTPGGAAFELAPTRAPSWADAEAPPPNASAASPPWTADPARDVSSVRAFIPESLILPSGRTVVVHPADVAPDGSLVVPPDPAQAGWWTGGARAGDPYGGVVLAGHIDSRAFGIGAMAELVHATTGQTVTVTAGHHVLSYRITSSREVPKATLASGTDTFSQDIPARLVLITCAGQFDPRRHTYAENLIVVATPLT